MFTPFLKPRAEQNRHGLRDPPLSGDPIPHRPRRHAQPGGGAHLGEPEPLESGTQLLGGHGHGALKIGTSCRCLASRHIVPTFPAWPIVRSQPRRDASAERSGCSKSSRISCGSWAPARYRVTTRYGRSWLRGAAYGSLCPHSGLLRIRFRHGRDFSAWLGAARRWVGSCSRRVPWSRAPFCCCCGWPGGACGLSCGWLTRFGLSDRDSSTPRSFARDAARRRIAQSFPRYGRTA